MNGGSFKITEGNIKLNFDFLTWDRHYQTSKIGKVTDYGTNEVIQSDHRINNWNNSKNIEAKLQNKNDRNSLEINWHLNFIAQI